MTSSKPSVHQTGGFPYLGLHTSKAKTMSNIFPVITALIFCRCSESKCVNVALVVELSTPCFFLMFISENLGSVENESKKNSVNDFQDYACGSCILREKFSFKTWILKTIPFSNYLHSWFFFRKAVKPNESFSCVFKQNDSF